MKFEIDDKTGMMLTKDSWPPDGTQLEHPRILFSNEVEQILQAVKKTQEKLVNKQIQEIQDSKNPHKIITQTDKQDNKWIIDASIDIEKIEDNQKIVDHVQDLIIASRRINSALKEINQTSIPFSMTLETLEQIYKTNGKDIKEL